MREICTSGSTRGLCQERVGGRDAVRKMEVDPSEPPCGRRLQTAGSCFGQKAAVVNVSVKRRGFDHVMCGIERRMQMNL